MQRCLGLTGACSPPVRPSSLQFGEHFEFDCKDCVCLEGGSGIVCRPKTCHPRPRMECEEEGTYAVTEVDPANICCNITSCSKASAGQGAGLALLWFLEVGASGRVRRRVGVGGATGVQTPGPSAAGPSPVQGGVGARPASSCAHWGVSPVFRMRRQPVQGEPPSVPTGLRGEEQNGP